MSAPDVGLWRSDDHTYYWNAKRIGPGVTRAIGKIEKPALVPWAKGVTADAALDNMDRLAAMLADEGRSVAKAWLTAHATAQTDTAKDLGTKIHLAAEQLARGATPEVETEHLPWVWAYQRFLADWQPKFKSIERFVANLTHGYGGTYDFIAEIDGKLTLADLKTGKAHYTETRMQLAALGRAEFIGMPNDPKQYPMPRIEQYAVLHVRPTAYERGYQLYRINVTDADYRAFLGALQIYRWAEQRPSNGEPMQIQEEAA